MKYTHTSTAALHELRTLIAQYGVHHGMMSPSIYDTARVLWFVPMTNEERQPAFEWLLAQQHADGSWGDPAVPLARHASTLAAVLAMHQQRFNPRAHTARNAGLAFLRQHADSWLPPLPDRLPVGVELTLPSMLDEAQAAGLALPDAPYAALRQLGVRRQQLLKYVPTHAGTTAVHSWEAWGTTPDASLIDPVGSVGNSPAATAAWINKAQQHPDLHSYAEQATAYLQAAAATTRVCIPGVVPTAWPVTHFERSSALYVLLCTGLLDHPFLADVVRPQIDALAQSLHRSVIGFSDWFEPDGDDTTMGLAVLVAAGYPVDISAADRLFALDNGQFRAYPFELQPALSVTAHAAHLYTLLGRDCSHSIAYLLQSQLADGRWEDDKWNGSWLYTSLQVLIAFGEVSDAPVQAARARLLDALLRTQQLDGSWGNAWVEETAYAVMALRAIERAGSLSEAGSQALWAAEQCLTNAYVQGHSPTACCWLAKESYRPERFARTYELAGLLVATVTERQIGGVAEAI